MRIGALVSRAIPDHLAGAERALHDTLAWLSTRGHECVVLATHGVYRGEHEGVMVIGRPSEAEVAGLAGCDVIVTQLEATMRAQLDAAMLGKPLVFYAHSPAQLEACGVLPECCGLLLNNSRHVAVANSWWPGDSMILHPPVFADQYRVEPTGRRVTMIGMSHRKGVMSFVQAARDLPHLQFGGVQGAYDEQVLEPGGFVTHGARGVSSAMPDNIGVVPPQLDMRPVYAGTRVLLVLSEHESWGRVAVEAMVSGIPVIATPTPGLLEACAAAGVYVDRNESRVLAGLIGDAFKDDVWGEWSAAALARAAHLDPVGELEEFEARLVKLVESGASASLA